MNIIIVGTAHPYRGGLAAFNERLATEYVKQGHNVETYTFTLQYPSFLFPGKTQYSNASAPALNIVRRINSCNPFNWMIVGKEIAGKSPDMVVFCYWTSFIAPCFGTIAKVVHRNRHTKCVALVHNMLPHEPSFIDKILPKYFVNNVDAFIALSKSVVADIEKIDKHNKPKTYSPHPIYDHFGERLLREDAINRLNLNPNCRYMLFFGLIRPYKGLDLLLNALADARIKDLNIKLIIAGEFYQDKNIYTDIIRNNGIGNLVELHSEYISDSIVNQYFSACDIVTLPYKSATQSGVTQIAFHFEKPMLVTNVGGLSEIVPNGKIGYVVEPNPKEIADAIVDFFANKRCEEFSQNVVSEKTKYAWNSFTSAIDKLYDEIKA